MPKNHVWEAQNSKWSPFFFIVVYYDAPPGGRPLGPIYRLNADHLEFCSSQTWFCPMRWLANPPSRADNPLWKPKTANQQWYQRLSILANVLKYPAKTHLGFLAHHSTISGVIHHQRHSKNGSIFEPGLVIRRFLWTQWHATHRFLWIQWSWVVSTYTRNWWVKWI